MNWKSSSWRFHFEDRVAGEALRAYDSVYILHLDPTFPQGDLMTHVALSTSRRRSLLFALLIAVFLPPLIHATEKVDLNGDWRFRTDPKSEGEKQEWNKSVPDGTEMVRVPHTWNIGKYDDYEGLAWYFRNFEVPALRSAHHLELHFAATFYKSRVWVNGVEAGSHEGGHTEYFFDITKLVKSGQNLIAVELDNRPTESSIPGLALKLKPGKNIWYDWWHYGGIVRDVWLAESEGIVIRRQQIRSEVANSSAKVRDAVYLENSGSKEEKLSVVVKLLSPTGTLSETKTQSVAMSAGGKQSLDFDLNIENAQLWDLDHANLYSIRVSVSDAAGHLLDEKLDSFGNRKIEIHDRHVYLNGERVRLAGMTRHEESPWEGLAETTGTIKHDYDDLKVLHTTLTRPVHYPQNERVFDYADQRGILLIPEIPVWQFTGEQLANPKVIALAKQMMQEMIEQAGNHPSIFAWSVCNESDMSTPGGRLYFKELKALVNAVDPSRFVSFADNDISYGADPTKEAAHDADFIMMNQYYGAWNGPEAGLIPMLDRAGKQFPDKMFIISEFGTPGVFATDTVEADKLRVHTLQYQLDVFQKYDWIAGAIFWCYQDYKSHRNLWPGNSSGYVDHGVVDENRQRRPSFFAWEKRTSPAVRKVKWKYGNWYEVGGFEVVAARQPLSQLPSYPLKDYKLHWELRDPDNKLLREGTFELANMDHEQTLNAEWKGDPSLHHLSLHLILTNPRSEVETEESLKYLYPTTGGQDIQDMTLPGIKP
jgi:beta-glucuronidase